MISLHLMASDWEERGKKRTYLYHPLNHIKLRNAGVLVPSLFSFVIVWMDPYRTAAKFNMAERALGSLIGQPSVKLASLVSPAFPQWCQGNWFFWPRCGFVVTVRRAEERWKWCHVDKEPFLLYSANMAAYLQTGLGRRASANHRVLWDFKLKVKFRKKKATIKWMFGLVMYYLWWMYSFWIMWRN